MKNKLLGKLIASAALISVVIALTGCGDKKDHSNTQKNNSIDGNLSVENTINTNKDEIEITSELDENSSLFVTDVTDNGDTYTLEGILYEEYIVTDNEIRAAIASGKIVIDGETYSVEKEDDDDIEMYELYKGGFAHFSIRKYEDSKYHLIRLAQISTCQRKTDKKKRITISKATQCEDIYTEEIETAETVFNNFTKLEPPDITHPTPSYTFEFENGDCSKIFVDTGL